MTSCAKALLAAFALVTSVSAIHAADLPPIKASEVNPVPDCATPGRLMAYLRSRNDKIDDKFSGIATAYMRHGEQLGLRWDYAFFQMMVETGSLSYTGDVKPSQNNFAGLGATGGGARGESFKDVPTGARAHLEHVLMYTGEMLENPVAERTRNIQEWGVLTSWQKNIKGPMTYAQLAKQWAPKSRGYPRDIAAVADHFYDGPCKEPDPQPELVAEAHGQASKSAVATAKAAPKTVIAVKGTDTDAKQLVTVGKSGLGAGDLATKPDAQVAAVQSDKPVQPSPSVKILNPAPTTSEASPLELEGNGKVETAAVAGAAKDAARPAKSGGGKCRVWTASYGGAKAIIIKAPSADQVNYTVLDVNEGAEKREAEAYITAYAKGGATLAEFPSQAQALEKAFELCPEG